MKAQSTMRVLPVIISVALAACLGCGPADDVPPPSLHKVSKAPEADVSAFQGALKISDVEIGDQGHSVILRGEAVQDLGTAPFPVTVDLLDAAGTSIGNTPAMLVLEEMPEREVHPAITAGSRIFINVGVARLKADPAKVVIKPGSFGPPMMGPGPAAPPR